MDLGRLLTVIVPAVVSHDAHADQLGVAGRVRRSRDAEDEVRIDPV